MQPGRHITIEAMCTRLRQLGINQTSRSTALLDLASELPVAILADLVGLHPATAALGVTAVCDGALTTGLGLPSIFSRRGTLSVRSRGTDRAAALPSFSRVRSGVAILVARG